MNKRTNYLSLILLDALEDENESDINFILERNSRAIDPSYVPQDRGIAPLHYVCGMENKQLALDVTKRFLEMGVDPNCRSDDNMTPLHVAAMYNREEIVRLLLQYGADLEVRDNDGKTPVLYAIDECNFEVVKIMRDHIFLKKYEKNKEKCVTIPSAELRHKNLLQQSVHNKSTSSLTLQLTPIKSDNQNTAKNKNLLKVTNSLDDPSLRGSENKKFTPNRINYNYDVTSPYYINITHRRHRPQPKFPDIPPEITKENSSLQNSNSTEGVLSVSMQNVNSSVQDLVVPINIFSLTKENLEELTERTASCERSRVSLIEIWKEKVQMSRARKSIIKQFDDVVEMIDQVIENDHLNFTNIALKEKPSGEETERKTDVEVDSGACASTSSSLLDITEYHDLPMLNTTTESNEKKTIKKPAMSLSNLMLTVAKAQPQNFESDQQKTEVSPALIEDLESSYQTVPEIKVTSINDNQIPQSQNNGSNGFRSPNKNEYFLQLTEAYVHTDDENGLVFYETKLLSNRQALQGNNCAPKAHGYDLDTTVTSQSTNITLPLDYETDTLRAELTAFGEPPGPITKTTKKLYIKKLIKCKRKTNIGGQLETQKRNEISKF